MIVTFTKRKIQAFRRQGVELVLGMLSFKYLTSKRAVKRQLKIQSGSQRDRLWSDAYRVNYFKRWK